MRVAASLWTAGATSIVVAWVNSIRLADPEVESWLDSMFTSLDVIIGLPPVLAGFIAFLSRERPLWVQLVTSVTLFVFVAPVTTLMTEWIRFAPTADAPNEGFYTTSVVFSFIYIHVPMLIASFVILALIGLMGWLWRRVSSIKRAA